MRNPRPEYRRRERRRAEGAGQVDRGAVPRFRRQRPGDGQARQPGRFGLLGQRRRREEAPPDGEAARPSAAADQRRNARAEEGAVLVVEVDARARRQRQPRRQVDVVLREDPRHIVGIAEARHVLRIVGVALVGRPDHPGVASDGAADRGFAEHRVVLVAFTHVPEPMIVVLPRGCRARRQHVAIRAAASARCRRRRSGGCRAPRCTAARWPRAPRPTSCRPRDPRAIRRPSRTPIGRCRRPRTAADAPPRA